MSVVPISTPPTGDPAARIAQLERELATLLAQQGVQRQSFRRNHTSRMLAAAAETQRRITVVKMELAQYQNVDDLL